MPVTLDAITRHLFDAFARVWGARLGGTAAMAPSTDASGVGWIVSVTASGAASGRIIVWVDKDAAAASTKLAGSLDREPEEAEISGFLREIVIEATASLGAEPEVAGVTFAEPSARLGVAPAGLQLSYLAIANVASCLVGVGVEPGAASASFGEPARRRPRRRPAARRPLRPRGDAAARARGARTGIGRGHGPLAG